jgi:hypothetical protein
MSNPALQQALSKIRWRILPFVALMFAMAIIDRSNIGLPSTPCRRTPA